MPETIGRRTTPIQSEAPTLGTVTGVPSLRVAMVDSGAFSPPYDIGLVAGLETLGVSVQVFGPAELLQWKDNPDAVAHAGAHGGVQRQLKKIRKLVAHSFRMLNVTLKAVTGRVDLVHFQWIPLPAFDYLFIRAIRLRVPVVFTMHNTSLFHGTTSKVRGFGLDACFRTFDCVIVHSRYSMARATVGGVIPEHRLTLIPHGAFEHYSALSSAQQKTVSAADEASVELLFAGSIKPYKGLADLIEALAVVHSANRSVPWRLTVAGEPGMDVVSLQHRAQDLGISQNIRWLLRHQSERELAELLEASDVVVLPYREIDQSGVLLAAVGVGKPVIATDVGAFSEIVVDEHNGLLVPPGNIPSLGDAIVRFVSDSDMRRRLAARMRALREGELSWEAVAARTLATYRNLLPKRS